MLKWGVRERLVYVGQRGVKQPQLSSNMAEEDDAFITEVPIIPEINKRKRLTLSKLKEVKASVQVKQEQNACPSNSHRKCKQKKDVSSTDTWSEENSLITEARIIPEVTKRKRLTLSKLKEVKASLQVKQEQSTCPSISYRKCKRKKNVSSTDRWSEERYGLAEQNMLEVLKAEGASFAKPITRPLLRMAARKYIGDTGLLDHLLKHIDGKVAPGGAERFRRWFNAEGIMEYWLEDANLENIRQEAGVHDPFWIPRSRSILGGGHVEDSVSAEELKLLKAEMTEMKRDMQELASKIRNQEELNSMEVIHKELVKKEAKTEERLNEITGYLKGLQGVVSGELMTWKTKVELQLMEITNSLGCINPTKPHPSIPPASERWDDWFESTNLDYIQDDEIASWLDGHNIVSTGQEIVVQDFHNASPLELKCGNNITQDHARAGKQEMSISKRNVMEHGGLKQEDDGANVTPDSSATGNSKSELDTSVHMFQEMLQELFNWKAKMEQQVMELSNSVRNLQGSHG